MLALPGAPNPARLPVLSALIIAYRVSSNGHAHKTKPAYIRPETCWVNFLVALLKFARTFPNVSVTLLVVKDTCTPALAAFVHTSAHTLLRLNARAHIRFVEFSTRFGDGSRSFDYVLDHLLCATSPWLGIRANASASANASAAEAATTAVYLVEDDYLHVSQNAVARILGGLQLASHSTGYDHPDKYVARTRAGNPLVQAGAGGEATRVQVGALCHYKITNSTTMTFATTLRCLWDDDCAWHAFTESAPPDDFHAWLALATTRGRTLVSTLPAACTHGETAQLAPFVDWAAIGARAIAFVRALTAL